MGFKLWTLCQTCLLLKVYQYLFPDNYNSVQCKQISHFFFINELLSHYMKIGSNLIFEIGYNYQQECRIVPVFHTLSLLTMICHYS